MKKSAISEYFNWELFDHPPYSTETTNNNDDFMEGVKMWLNPQAIDIF
jgi:hypothetical protein